MKSQNILGLLNLAMKFLLDLLVMTLIDYIKFLSLGIERYQDKAR